MTNVLLSAVDVRIHSESPEGSTTSARNTLITVVRDTVVLMCAEVVGRCDLE